MISLTPNAADQVKRQLARRGKGLGLRLGIRKAGCSGFAYVIDYADEVSRTDAVFEHQGVKVVVDSQHLGYLDGLELDYTREGLNAAFRFRNPNIKGTCGCGESFSV